MAQAKKDDAQKQRQEAPKEVETVPMVRDGQTADVHPLEVENMKAHDWKVANASADQ